MKHPCTVAVTRACNTPTLVIALAVLALTLSAAGCGSTNGASSTATGQSPAAHLQSSTAAGQSAATRTQQPVIAQANQICRQLNIEFAADKPANSGVTELVRVAPHRAILEARVVRQLSKLTPPPSMARAWRQILSYRQTLAQELSQLVHYARADNVSGIRALAVSKERNHKLLSALAHRHQLKDCARIG